MTTNDERRIRRVGDRAILIEVGDRDAAARAELAERFREAFPPPIEVIAAARTILIRTFDGRSFRCVSEAVREWCAGRGPAVPAELSAASSAEPREGRTITIDTVYRGWDLDAVAEIMGVSRDAVIHRHSETAWLAEFGGFSPGFMYLTGDAALSVPRLGSPRTEIPAGSVALAGGYSAVYPSASPGGWRIIGTTSEQLWDETRAEPSLITPGDTVRFRPVPAVARMRRAAPVDESSSGAAGTAPARSEAGTAPARIADDETVPAFTVVDPGPLTLIEDLGRAGHSAIGVSPSGALDRAALVEANLLVGNDPGAAALETLGRVVLRVHQPLRMAVTGGEAALCIETRGEARREVRHGEPFDVAVGDVVRIGPPVRGLRPYLSVSGGVEAERVLGSRARDTLSRLGPPPLRRGDRVVLADERAAGVRSARGAAAAAPARDRSSTVFRVVPGPRSDWFAPGALRRLTRVPWRITDRADRVAAGLDAADPLPAPLARSIEYRDVELASEGLVRGAIQVPADGEPIVFLADHPVTGGYPVIGVVVDADIDRFAQLRPGDTVRFAATEPDTDFERETRAASVPVTFEVDGRRLPTRLPAALAERLDALGRADRAAIMARILSAVRAEASRPASNE